MPIFLITILLAIVYFAIGAAWYSPILFGNLWKKAIKKSEKELKEANMAIPMVVSFICILFLMFGMIHFFGYNPDATSLVNGYRGFLAAILIALPVSTINHVYEGKPWQLWLINMGYMVVGLSTTGLLYRFLA